MKPYIYLRKSWPHFTWDNEVLLSTLGKVRNIQGRLIGKMESLGFELGNEATLKILTQDVVKSSEIEGEILNPEQVRSSVARRLDLDVSGLIASERNVDGMVEMMFDATRKCNKPLTSERLFGWHSALFPAGRSGMSKIRVGEWRNDSRGPMQVVSGAMGHERVHFQAPEASILKKEIKLFLDWVNKEEALDPVIKAGIAHLWFVTIHPFDDGNGRIARAIADMLLARSDGSSQRFYSMSAQITLERRDYYNILEETQKGTLDITNWLHWFLNCLINAINASDRTFAKVIYKSEFWKNPLTIGLNDRQKLILNMLLDGFNGKLTSSKWAKIAKCSPDTALRDIQDLIIKGVLYKEASGGRSTNYELKGNSHPN
jgi:Fic family protein